MTFYLLTKFWNLETTFSSEPFACNGELFTLNTLFKDVTHLFSWKDLTLLFQIHHPNLAWFIFPTLLHMDKGQIPVGCWGEGLLKLQIVWCIICYFWQSGRFDSMSFVFALASSHWTILTFSMSNLCILPFLALLYLNCSSNLEQKKWLLLKKINVR